MSSTVTAYDAFLAEVRRRAGLRSEDDAARAVRATLQTLAERLSGGEALDLARHLPDELADALRRGDRRLLEGDGQGPEPAADRAPDGRAERPALMPETVEIHAPDTVSRRTVAAARQRVAELQRHTDLPLNAARLTLRHPETRAARSRWIADASVLLDGRLLAAHATGPTALAAADAVVGRLRRQIRRAVESGVAMRNEPRTIARALAGLRAEAAHRPAADLMPARPGDRRLVHRITAPAAPVRVGEAAADLVDGDLEFRLFLDEHSGDWLLVHRRDDDRIGVVHPPWTRLPDLVSDVFVVESLEQPQPRTLEDAMAQLEHSGERFTYFVDAADGRPKVLYLRHDGDYGLVEPERTLADDVDPG